MYRYEMEQPHPDLDWIEDLATIEHINEYLSDLAEEGVTV